MMTAAELREILSKFPDDAQVLCYLLSEPDEDLRYCVISDVAPNWGPLANKPGKDVLLGISVL